MTSANVRSRHNRVWHPDIRDQFLIHITWNLWGRKLVLSEFTWTMSSLHYFAKVGHKSGVFFSSFEGTTKFGSKIPNLLSYLRFPSVRLAI